MKTLFQHELGHAKLMIGMVHTLPLPGAPGYDRAAGMRPVVERALADAGALQDAGFHAVMFSNEFDMPYEMTMRRETIAAMTAVVMEARPRSGSRTG
jgi:predicted TIM-barrel enzyme